jgi:hypothetical protein
MLFNEVPVDSYFLEYDTERAGTFEPLRFVPKNKSVMLGLVSSKRPELESKDALKRRIDEAARYVDLDQLALSPQCGFASTAPGNRLSVEQQNAKLRRVVEAGARGLELTPCAANTIRPIIRSSASHHESRRRKGSRTSASRWPPWTPSPSPRSATT